MTADVKFYKMERKQNLLLVTGERQAFRHKSRRFYIKQFQSVALAGSLAANPSEAAA